MKTSNEEKLKIDANILDEKNILNRIRERVEPLLENIQDKEKKEAVSNFWYNNFYEFVMKLSDIDHLMKENTLTPENAYDVIYKINKKIITEGVLIEKIIDDKQLIKEIKHLFRTLNGEWIYKSKITKHAYEKPLGYPGDYQIIEIIYNNKIISSGIGYCCDKFFLNELYSSAVRARKNKMKDILELFIQTNEKISILNIACGPSREIRELVSEKKIPELKEINFTLIDHDVNALFYSEKNLQKIPNNIKFNYINNNVLDYRHKTDKYHQYLNGQDLIYSIGLFDYLPTIVIQKLIPFFYSLLNEKGKLIIAHKDSKKYIPHEPDWWCNWNFYHRSKEEVINLINNSGIQNYSITITNEEVTNIIFFLIIEKNK